MTLIEMLIKQNRAFPSKPAIICEDKRVSYTELFEKVVAMSHHLFISGVTKKQRVVIMMESKKPELIISFLAIAACGAIVVPVDCNQPDDYINRMFQIISPSSIMISTKMHHRLDKINHNLSQSRIVILSDDNMELSPTNSRDYGFPPVSVSDHDTVYFNMTSGTTGVPKCAVTTHENIYFNTLASVEHFSLTSDDVHLCMFPPATHPHEIFARALFLGGTMVLTDHIAPKSLTRVIEKNKVTAMMAIAPIYGNFTRCHKRNDFKFSTLKIAESGGMHLDPVTAAEFRKRFGIPIIPVWGSTETAGIALAMPLKMPLRISHEVKITTGSAYPRSKESTYPVPEEPSYPTPEEPAYPATEESAYPATEEPAYPATEEPASSASEDTTSKSGSCGVPCRYYEVDIVNKEGISLPSGEIGEMIVKGKGVCSSYYSNDNENIKNFKNGWYYTNDMFKKDEDGFFYFAGRKNGMMKVAGMKVYPVEIEDLLIQHPLIKEVCVVRTSDPVHGEIPRAVIVPEDEANLTKEEIRLYCNSRLAFYKIPKIIEFRASLPRNPVGKIMAHQL
ncbi:hypothetical protein MTBBW1_2210011 [Desulfamplus magnetovallimortis]|uniref:Long-chain-fatty-acid--CoA ligase n=1 Tax=Desulfamplus magnetovallimortis TaxID=1246637 RepID=A0A1W1HD26_9BACT|nr:AMP-binding protein [Desulfamplus magnetovallimortis]SLM30407.1 hypothetical protein MTBBW1_2210011 [Desulfamplus magnetovallimortis]